MATLMLEHGADIRFIQALLSHAELSTTEIYTQVSITKLKAVHEATHPARLRQRGGGGLAIKAAPRQPKRPIPRPPWRYWLPWRSRPRSSLIAWVNRLSSTCRPGRGHGSLRGRLLAAA